MKFSNKLINTTYKAITSASLFIGENSVNSPSIIIYHQPKVPESLKKNKE